MRDQNQPHPKIRLDDILQDKQHDTAKRIHYGSYE